MQDLLIAARIALVAGQRPLQNYGTPRELQAMSVWASLYANVHALSMPRVIHARCSHVGDSLAAFGHNNGRSISLKTGPIQIG